MPLNFELSLCFFIFHSQSVFHTKSAKMVPLSYKMIKLHFDCYLIEHI